MAKRQLPGGEEPLRSMVDYIIGKDVDGMVVVFAHCFVVGNQSGVFRNGPFIWKIRRERNVGEAKMSGSGRTVEIGRTL